MKKRTIQMLSLVLILAMCCGLLAGCGKGSAPEITSAEAGLYVYGTSVCDVNGSILSDYSLDEAGNILDVKGKIAVSSEKAAAFTCPTSVEVKNKAELKQELEATKLEDEKIAVREKKVKLDLVFSGSPFTNSVVFLESTAPEVLYFTREDNEANIYEPAQSDVAASPSPAADEQGDFLDNISLVPAEDGSLSVYFVCAYEGTADIIVRNIVGKEINTFNVEVTAKIEEVEEDEDKDEEEKEDKEGEEAEEDKAPHQHKFNTRVVAPTVRTQGYTVYTCKDCGYSYRDNYTPKLPCSHSYDKKVVPPSYTTEGYTVYTCSICGHSYTGDRTDKLVCSHANCSSEVVPATCDTDGYTLHRCLTCKSYEYKDNKVAALGHVYDAGRITVEPTCATLGTKVFTCSRCNKTRTESLPTTNQHKFVDTHVDGTCLFPERTEHKCSVCGYQYSDFGTTPLGHDWGEWTDVTPATCGNAGMKQRVCNRDNSHVEQMPIPATGAHNFVAGEAVPPSCDAGGHTVYTCTGCGASEQRDQTEALGHAWEQKSEVVTESVYGTWCKDCGMDIGPLGQAGVSQHIIDHALAGGLGGHWSGYKEIQKTVTYNECSRCHARQ